jgi:hypothetical protein
MDPAQMSSTEFMIVRGLSAICLVTLGYCLKIKSKKLFGDENYLESKVKFILNKFIKIIKFIKIRI